MNREVNSGTLEESDCMPLENPQFFLTPDEALQASVDGPGEEFRPRWWRSEGFVDSELQTRIKVKKPR